VSERLTADLNRSLEHSFTEPTAFERALASFKGELLAMSPDITASTKVACSVDSAVISIDSD
jgi:hypothetical protein